MKMAALLFLKLYHTPSAVELRGIWILQDPVELTLKAPITTAADDIYKYFFNVFQRNEDLIFHGNLLLGRGFT